MAWYEIKITPEAKRDYANGGRAIFVWDVRRQCEIVASLKEHRSIELLRAAPTEDRTKMSARGAITIFEAHIISIEDRIDLNERFPRGAS